MLYVGKHVLLRVEELELQFQNVAILTLPQLLPALELKSNRFCVFVPGGKANIPALSRVITCPEASAGDEEEARPWNDTSKGIVLLHPSLFVTQVHPRFLHEWIVIDCSVAQVSSLLNHHLLDLNRRYHIIVYLSANVDEEYAE